MIVNDTEVALEIGSLRARLHAAMELKDDKSQIQVASEILGDLLPLISRLFVERYEPDAVWLGPIDGDIFVDWRNYDESFKDYRWRLMVGVNGSCVLIKSISMCIIADKILFQHVICSSDGKFSQEAMEQWLHDARWDYPRLLQGLITGVDAMLQADPGRFVPPTVEID